MSLKSTLWITLAVALIMRLGYLVYFFDFGWEPDSYMHILNVYDISSNLPESLWNLLSIWSKPLYTTFYFLVDIVTPTSIPRLFLFQLINTFWILGAVALTYKAFEPLITKNKLATALAVLILFLMSFITFRASVSALTEPIGAFCSALSIYLISRRKFVWSSLALGTCVLARIDMGLPCVVHAIYISIYLLRSSEPNKFRQVVLVLLATFLPVGLWNLLGYYRTGELFFLLTKGYPTQAGIYGYGRIGYYAEMFWKLDPIFWICYLVGIVIWGFKYRKNLLLNLCLYVSSTYFIVMTILWCRGSFGLAGLARYYVVVLPYFFITSFLTIKLISEQIDLRKPRFRYLLPVILFLGSLPTLKPLIRKPKWKYGQWTAPATIREPYQKIKNHREEFEGLPVHSDRPEVPYYLGHRSRSQRHPLRKARDMKTKGVFVYVQGWSDGVSSVNHSHFSNARKVASYPGNIEIFIRD